MLSLGCRTVRKGKNRVVRVGVAVNVQIKGISELKNLVCNFTKHCSAVLLF